MFAAILVNWTMDSDQRLRGRCYADERKPTMSSGFARGEAITTSPCVSIAREDGELIATTSSGTGYLLA